MGQALRIRCGFCLHPSLKRNNLSLKLSHMRVGFFEEPLLR